VSDNLMKYNIGYLIIALTSFNIIINLFIMVFETYSTIKKKTKYIKAFYLKLIDRLSKKKDICLKMIPLQTGLLYFILRIKLISSNTHLMYKI
jgi:hypothetical protein